MKIKRSTEQSEYQQRKDTQYFHKRKRHAGMKIINKKTEQNKTNASSP